MSLFRKLFLHSPLKYIISFIVGGAIAVGVLFIEGFDIKMSYQDAFFIAGAVLVVTGGLSFVTYFGGFDIFVYGFMSFNPNRRYKDLYEYSEAKKEKRRSKSIPFMPYIVIGVIYIIVSLFFMI